MSDFTIPPGIEVPELEMIAKCASYNTCIGCGAYASCRYGEDIEPLYEPCIAALCRVIREQDRMIRTLLLDEMQNGDRMTEPLDDAIADLRRRVREEGESMSERQIHGLEHDLSSLLNNYSAENASNTPDFILSQYMLSCLAAFTTATQQREGWFGRDPRPTTPGADLKSYCCVQDEAERDETRMQARKFATAFGILYDKFPAEAHEAWRKAGELGGEVA